MDDDGGCATAPETPITLMAAAINILPNDMSFLPSLVPQLAQSIDYGVSVLALNGAEGAPSIISFR